MPRAYTHTRALTTDTSPLTMRKIGQSFHINFRSVDSEPDPTSKHTQHTTALQTDGSYEGYIRNNLHRESGDFRIDVSYTDSIASETGTFTYRVTGFTQPITRRMSLRSILIKHPGDAEGIPYTYDVTQPTASVGLPPGTANATPINYNYEIESVAPDTPGSVVYLADVPYNRGAGRIYLEDLDNMQTDTITGWIQYINTRGRSAFGQTRSPFPVNGRVRDATSYWLFYGNTFRDHKVVGQVTYTDDNGTHTLDIDSPFW